MQWFQISVQTNKQKYESKRQNERYPDFACSHEPYYYLDLHELNFPDRDERGCGLVNMTVHVSWMSCRQ